MYVCFSGLGSRNRMKQRMEKLPGFEAHLDLSAVLFDLLCQLIPQAALGRTYFHFEGGLCFLIESCVDLLRKRKTRP